MELPWVRLLRKATIAQIPYEQFAEDVKLLLDARYISTIGRFWAKLQRAGAQRAAHDERCRMILKQPRWCE